jgi:hypothetical protein
MPSRTISSAIFRPFKRPAGQRAVWLALGSALFCASAAWAGPGDTAAPVDPTQKPADVIVLVRPLSADTANVGLVYRQRVSHDRVKREITRLTESSGWRIGRDLVIKDESVHADNTAQFPVTTGAMFTLTQAPQIANGVPALMPYLHAFQKWNIVEVMFGQSDLTPYRGPDKFDSAAYSVRLIKNPNVYRYEVAIREHDRALPEPPAVAAKTAPDSASVSSGAMAARAGLPTPPSLPLMLILAGAGLIGGAGIYRLLTRRTPSPPSARTLRP